MKKEVTADTTIIQRIIRYCYKQLYANKMHNLEEMDKFLEWYNHLRLNQEEVQNINRPTTSTEIETVIKKIPTNKSLGPDGFTGDFCQPFREELTPVLIKLLQKVSEEETLYSSLYKANIILITKPDKDTTKKKKKNLQANITDEHRHKYPQKNTSKLNRATH